MKQNFEDALHEVRDVVKEKPDPSDVERRIDEELREVTDESEQRRQLERMIPEAARIQVFELQKEKQVIMDWVHEQFRVADKGEPVEGFDEALEGEPSYIVQGNMEVACVDGSTAKVTKGMVATDGEWGIHYRLNADVDHSVKKRFIVSEAKRAIRKLADRQIAISEVAREVPVEYLGAPIGDYMLNMRNVYNGVARGTSRKNFEGDGAWGFVAETMTSTFMEQVQIDGGFSYRFTPGDVFDDNERKMDFLIKIPSHVRGVKTIGENTGIIGIQFYAGRRSSEMAHKTEQIQEAKEKFGLGGIDDIVLVSVPLKVLEGAYNTWKAEGKKPGGPTVLLDNSAKETVFRGVLNKFFEDAVVDEMWREADANLVSDDRKLFSDSAPISPVVVEKGVVIKEPLEAYFRRILRAQAGLSTKENLLGPRKGDPKKGPSAPDAPLPKEARGGTVQTERSDTERFSEQEMQMIMEKLKEYPEYTLSGEKTLRRKILNMQKTEKGQENLEKVLDMSRRGIKAEDTEEFRECLPDMLKRHSGSADRARMSAIRYVWNRLLQN